MIKSLLEPDEPESKEKTENTDNREDALKLPFQEALKRSENIPTVERLPEKNYQPPANTAAFENNVSQNESDTMIELESRLAEIESMSDSELEKLYSAGENLLGNREANLLPQDREQTDNADPYAGTETAVSIPKSVYDDVAPTQNVNVAQNQELDPPQVKAKDFAPETKAESLRQTGMAWSAAIALFGSIVFFMIIGWFADLLLGSAPWGLVGGIVIGGVMGFVQFFRINSKIFKPQKSDFERTSLRGNEDAEIIEVIEVVEAAPTENKIF